MPSKAMHDLLDTFRNQQQASASQTPPTLEERRATFAPAGRLHPVPDDVVVTEVIAGGVPAHWLDAPGVDAGRVLLFLHVGGYELGSLRSDGELAARLGRASGMRVLFPEYRLAPEHPFPAAIDDVVAAWRWLRNDQSLSAESIAVAGGSAGGGLAVALLVAARDAGEPSPAAAVLMSPTVDLTSSGASMSERADQDPISTPAMLAQFASEYLAGADPKTPLASPLFASLTGLPPLLVQVGTADLLFSDSDRLAAAAAEAGVDVKLEIGERLPHVYQILLGTPEAAEATDRIGKFLRSTTMPTHEPQPSRLRRVRPEEIDWEPFPAFPPPARLAVIVGNTSEPAPYVVRVKVPSGVKLMPHTHHEDRVYTVMSGVFYIGVGEHFDDRKLEAYPPGAVIVLPGGTPHFHWAKSGEYVTQVTAIGPISLEYVDPADDPRNKQAISG